MIKRGEIWIIRGHGYGSKPRPGIVIQNDDIQIESVTVVPLTTDRGEAESTRVPVLVRGPEMSRLSFAMVDKVMPIRRIDFGPRVDVVDEKLLRDIERELAGHLDLHHDAA
ncbi:MAG: type II toxin-antitoxin system PemK/MazF family toxin [Actinobacteria bacterium]|nr:type II toxin-antitoxin system PemK/MazF family toxin [Actinomycetota bacterium]